MCVHLFIGVFDSDSEKDQKKELKEPRLRNPGQIAFLQRRSHQPSRAALQVLCSTLASQNHLDAMMCYNSFFHVCCFRFMYSVSSVVVRKPRTWGLLEGQTGTPGGVGARLLSSQCAKPYM